MENIAVKGDFKIGDSLSITGTVTKAGSPDNGGLCEVKVENVDGPESAEASDAPLDEAVGAGAKGKGPAKRAFKDYSGSLLEGE